MSLSNILFLSAIIFAFVLFGVVLAWCDFYTQRTSRPNGQQAQSPPTEQNRVKNAA